MMLSMTGGWCPSNGNYYNGSCFYVSKTKENQTTARAACQAMDADLASISDPAEMDFVKSIS